MFVHEAGVGIMICGVGVVFCARVGVLFFAQEARSKSIKKKGKSLLMFD
jgi:hypothetical protein